MEWNGEEGMEMVWRRSELFFDDLEDVDSFIEWFGGCQFIL